MVRIEAVLECFHLLGKVPLVTRYIFYCWCAWGYQLGCNLTKPVSDFCKGQDSRRSTCVCSVESRKALFPGGFDSSGKQRENAPTHPRFHEGVATVLQSTHSMSGRTTIAQSNVMVRNTALSQTA